MENFTQVPNLPQEIILNILKYCDSGTLIEAEQVSNEWFSYIQYLDKVHNIWKKKSEHELDRNDILIVKENCDIEYQCDYRFFYKVIQRWKKIKNAKIQFSIFKDEFFNCVPLGLKKKDSCYVASYDKQYVFYDSNFEILNSFKNSPNVLFNLIFTDQIGFWLLSLRGRELILFKIDDETAIEINNNAQHFSWNLTESIVSVLTYDLKIMNYNLDLDSLAKFLVTKQNLHKKDIVKYINGTTIYLANVPRVLHHWNSQTIVYSGYKKCFIFNSSKYLSTKDIRLSTSSSRGVPYVFGHEIFADFDDNSIQIEMFRPDKKAFENFIEISSYRSFFCASVTAMRIHGTLVYIGLGTGILYIYDLNNFNLPCYLHKINLQDEFANEEKCYSPIVTINIYENLDCQEILVTTRDLIYIIKLIV